MPYLPIIPASHTSLLFPVSARFPPPTFLACWHWRQHHMNNKALVPTDLFNNCITTSFLSINCFFPLFLILTKRPLIPGNSFQSCRHFLLRGGELCVVSINRKEMPFLHVQVFIAQVIKIILYHANRWWSWPYSKENVFKPECLKDLSCQQKFDWQFFWLWCCCFGGGLTKECATRFPPRGLCNNC